ncbi:MAG: GNAT family N-acetyltransferase [Verrucomicrobiota bacterium JB022]|nr:GNAT family N-acetyltransferase [Verrucomicrobiota bacterium JB022]
MAAASQSTPLYASAGYAQSFAEWMQPVPLPRAGGHLLARAWQATGWDLMAPYPLLQVANWQALEEDLAGLDPRYASLVGVTDSLADVTEAQLQALFPALCRPFKQHQIVDLQNEPASHFSKHHQRYARAAAKVVEVEELPSPVEVLDTWCALYDELIRRHEITGLTRFSRESFAVLLGQPGCRAFAARHRESGEIVGMILMADAGIDTHYHLGAYSPAGYEAKASFALFDAIIARYAQEGFRFLNLGGGAGFKDDPNDGLAQFKRGWATIQRPSYLIGRIINHAYYENWSNSADALDSAYFPAYRDPHLRPSFSDRS